MADIALQAELCALREELEGCREETKLQEEVKKLSDQCTSAATIKELQGVQEQVTALWRQTVALTDEMEVLAPAVKEDLLSWKLGITSRVAEHEGRLKCLAETTAMQTMGRGGVATMPGERPDVQLSDEMLLMRMDLHSLREQVGSWSTTPLSRHGKRTFLGFGGIVHLNLHTWLVKGTLLCSLQNFGCWAHRVFNAYMVVFSAYF